MVDGATDKRRSGSQTVVLRIGSVELTCVNEWPANGRTGRDLAIERIRNWLNQSQPLAIVGGRQLIQVKKVQGQVGALGTGVAQFNHRLRGNLVLDDQIPLLDIWVGSIGKAGVEASSFQFAQTARVVANRLQDTVRKWIAESGI